MIIPVWCYIITSYMQQKLETITLNTGWPLWPLWNCKCCCADLWKQARLRLMAVLVKSLFESKDGIQNKRFQVRESYLSRQVQRPFLICYTNKNLITSDLDSLCLLDFSFCRGSGEEHLPCCIFNSKSIAVGGGHNVRLQRETCYSLFYFKGE